MDLYTSSPSELARYDDYILRERGMTNEGQMALLGGYQQPKDGGGVNWGAIAGAGANIGAAYMGGRQQSRAGAGYNMF
jgi:hypothetical protein